MHVRKSIKRLFAIVICVCIGIIIMFGTFSSIAFAEGVFKPNIKEEVYVYDEEGLLPDEQLNDLNYLLRNLKEKTGVEFAVVTVSSFNGYSIEDYANSLFNQMGLGDAKTDNGILLLISRHEGHGRLEIGYGLEEFLNDSKCGRILDEYYVPNRDQGNDLDSVVMTAKGVLAELGKKFNVELVENQDEIINRIQEDDDREKIIEFIILIIVLIVCVIIAVSQDSYGGSGHYYGGSRGGFGGFGGGHSGGGGASR